MLILFFFFPIQWSSCGSGYNSRVDTDLGVGFAESWSFWGIGRRNYGTTMKGVVWWLCGSEM